MAMLQPPADLDADGLTAWCQARAEDFERDPQTKSKAELCRIFERIARHLPVTSPQAVRPSPHLAPADRDLFHATLVIASHDRRQVLERRALAFDRAQGWQRYGFANRHEFFRSITASDEEARLLARTWGRLVQQGAGQ